ncbi:MAG: cytochrome c biogenesis protein CcsA [Betaproteobacteria bacterium]
MILLHFAVAALYAAAAWSSWPRATAPFPVAARAWLLPLALALHAYAIARAIVTPIGLDLSFANALSLVAGLAVLVAWASGIMRTLPGISAVVLPVAAVCALGPTFGESPHRFAYAEEPWAAIHIAVALLAYALFVVAALQALVLIGLESRLRRGLPAESEGSVPPLLMLERFMFRLVGLGFALLTATLVTGFLFSEEIFGRPLTFTHKNVFSVAGWLAFAVLLIGRWRYGWRGRRALRWILAGTLLLVLGYLGSKFVAEVLLSR